jgi:hypothetical protein
VHPNGLSLAGGWLELNSEETPVEGSEPHHGVIGPMTRTGVLAGSNMSAVWVVEPGLYGPNPSVSIKY